MDNKAWILERLKNPALLGTGDENRLREIIASYPAFSAPYLLLARRLHEMQHSAYESLLPALSLRAYDRKKLFYLIHAYPNLQKVQDSPSPLVEQEMSSILPGSRFAIDFTSIEKEAETKEAETKEEGTAELSEIPFTQIRQKHLDEVEVEDEEVLESRIDGETESQRDGETEEVKVEVEVEVEEERQRDGETDVQIDDAEVEVEVEVEVEKASSEIPEESVPAADFMTWLNQLSMTPTEHVETPKETGIHTIDSVDVIPSKREVQAEEPVPMEEPVSEVDNLIDKFIETQPSVRRVKNEFFSPVNAAKQSEQEPDDLVTETIARILVKQEKFDKAIQAYEKLQLKYPAKNDYFAGLILELKQKTT